MGILSSINSKFKEFDEPNMIVVSHEEHMRMHGNDLGLRRAKCANCVCLTCLRKSACRCQLCLKDVKSKLSCEEKTVCK